MNDKNQTLIPESWDLPTVAASVRPFRYERAKKIAKSAYLAEGRWPIIDQGQQVVAGYTDDNSKIITPPEPIIIFGDHTRIFKYVDYEFALGADGTKPLLAASGFEPRFLFHALSHLDVPSRGYSRHYKALSEMRVPKPSLEEQREIADTLQTWDTAIEKTKTLVAAKEKQFDWLITRFVKNYKTTARLGEICTYEKGEKICGGEGTMKYLEIGDVDIASKDYDLENKSKKPVQGAVKVPAGTTLVSTVRPTRGAITKTKAEVYVSPAFCRMKLPNDFFFYCLHQGRFFKWLEARQSGGTYPTVKDKDILNFKVPCPPTSEQESVAQTLNMAKQEITLLKSLADQYQIQKRGLMQKLLTGKWRIPLSQNNFPGGNGNG